MEHFSNDHRFESFNEVEGTWQEFSDLKRQEWYLEKIRNLEELWKTVVNNATTSLHFEFGRLRVLGGLQKCKHSNEHTKEHEYVYVKSISLALLEGEFKE
ncbi:hypothetical protein KIN20_010125 [Parelaphostrongylus tenuis]|uniref:Uncharacterized protein n=1 Tax=Parelaphostrongylus tenuis TaxID=148309 RepID=A0AAD5QNW1_PARTN|nr:hypothetical protein KIN20_010125 [Parelaphostrongylus tenuis]